MRAYRIGLVGTGGIAHRHMDGYRRVLGSRAEVTAACDLRPDVLHDFCDRYGVESRFTEPSALMASGEVDVAVDLTPPSARDEVVSPAIEHRMPVLVEKPFAATAKRAACYVRDATAAGCTIAVDQNLRWFPEIRDTRSALGGGEFGPVRFVHHHHFQNRPLVPGVWRAAEERLEMAIFGVHIIDRVQWLAGANPVAVAAVTRRDPHGSLPGEQFASLLIHFEGGVVGQMTSNWLSKALPESTLRVDADRGSITARRRSALFGDASWSAAFEGADPIVREFRDDGDFDASFGHSMRALLDGLDADREPLNSGRDNLKTMGIMDAAYLSASRGGELVTVEEALSGPPPAPSTEGAADG